MGALGEFRDLIVGRLAELNPDEWSVYPTVVDAVEPPAFMLEWTPAPQWILPSSFCRYATYLDVLAIAGRVDVEGGIEFLETMIEAAFPVLEGHVVQALAPGPFEIGGVRYLAARITLQSQLTLGGSENG